ncbi:MAG: biotin/lipoyl-binding protein, partial [Planctomycetota bacterium]
MKKLIVGLLIIIVVTVIVIRIIPKKSVETNGEKIIPVTIKEFTRSDIVETTSCFGTVKALNQVDIYAKVNGRVEKLLVKDGQEVKNDDVLAILEYSAIKAQIEQSEAGLNAAKAQLKQAEINLENLSKELQRV